MWMGRLKWGSVPDVGHLYVLIKIESGTGRIVVPALSDALKSYIWYGYLKVLCEANFEDMLVSKILGVATSCFILIISHK